MVPMEDKRLGGVGCLAGRGAGTWAASTSILIVLLLLPVADFHGCDSRPLAVADGAGADNSGAAAGVCRCDWVCGDKHIIIVFIAVVVVVVAGVSLVVAGGGGIARCGGGLLTPVPPGKLMFG